ncbi:DUF6010 family protein [Streptomyces anandii]|uniref:DUF6010 family protein n=1 Tax=Streptomyces anandii TaxID=285454 RepID=UPI00167BC51C|nr:hypothetical protein GCM10010510_54450 [Streptomyces anandii JCM 4720]
MLRYVMPVVIGALYVLVLSLPREPHRRRIDAIMVAGAGAAYLRGGGLGGWEFAGGPSMSFRRSGGLSFVRNARTRGADHE